MIMLALVSMAHIQIGGVLQARSWVQKILGALVLPLPLLFDLGREEKVNLHMFFMRKRLDVIFLDDCMMVVEIKKGLGPWQVYNTKVPARYVLEMHFGFLKDKYIKLGDTVSV